MNTRTTTNGNEIDTSARNSAHLVAISPLYTLKDLLAALDGDPHIAMLRTTASHISACLNLPDDQLAIDYLVDAGSRFSAFLEGRRHKRNAIRSYCYYAGLLLRRARELGWITRSPEVPEPWIPVLAAARKGKGCAGVVHYAIREGKMPLEFGDDDLHEWGEMMLNKKRSYRHVEAVKRNFRHLVSQGKFARLLPGISFRSEPFRYAIPFRSLPPQLRAEVTAIMKWKQDPFVPGRPQKARLRAISAKEIPVVIARLYTYVTRTEPENTIESIPELVTAERVAGFVAWLLNERKIQGETLIPQLARLRAALRHPKYKAYDFDWLGALLLTIPQDSEAKRLERKAQKYLPYDVLSEIPERIGDKRRQSTNLSAVQIAFLVHDELLMRWLITMVWRSRNVRECRIVCSGDGANLSKKELPLLANIAVPIWAQREWKLNPHQQFWQFYFRKDETKTGNEVRGIVPHRLVPLLEEYLEHQRSTLLRGRDPGTLFVNRKGTALTGTQLGLLISDLTLRYSNHRVTPHLFRDVLAFKWLEDHPEDYLTISRALWHRNIETTLQVYGRRFDESHALRRVEEWLDRRVEGPAHTTEGTTEGASELRPSATENHTADYKMEYEQQRKITERLMDQIEQLEEQYRQHTVESQSGPSHLQPKIQPRKVKSVFRKTGSGVA